MVTEEEILLRIQKNPSEHLAEYDLDYYRAYRLGYELALCENGVSEINIIVPTDKFEQYLKDKYKIKEYPCNIRYDSYLELITSSKKEYFDLYISEKLNASKSFNIQKETIKIASKKNYTSSDYFENITKRPGMYFGNNFSSLHLGSFFLGYEWAIKDYDLKKTFLTKNYSNFQAWYDTKAPFAIGYPWYKTMLIQTLHSYNHSFYCFIQDYSDFLEGKPSNYRLKESVNIAFEELMKDLDK